MPSPCLQICVEVAARFGLQNQELNISLTAIGLLVRACVCVVCVLCVYNACSCPRPPSHALFFFSAFQWNISDYFYQNREKIIKELDRDLSTREKAKLNMAPFDGLWMCLYSKLGKGHTENSRT